MTGARERQNEVTKCGQRGRKETRESHARPPTQCGMPSSGAESGSIRDAVLPYSVHLTTMEPGGRGLTVCLTVGTSTEVREKEHVKEGRQGGE